MGVTPTARHPVPVVRHYAGPDPAPGTLTSDGGDTPWCIILGLVIGVFVGSTLGFLVCAVLMAGDRGDRQIRMVSTQSSRRSLEKRFIADPDAPDEARDKEELSREIASQLRRAAAKLAPGDPWRQDFTALADRLEETLRRRRAMRFLS